MINEQIEQLAALHALGLLDEAGQVTLLAAAEREPEVRELIAGMAEAAAALAYDAPPVAPPPAVKRELMRQLPRHPAAASARVLAFPQWVPFALAACLAALAVWQEFIIAGLTTRVRGAQAEVAALYHRNNMVEMRLASLEAKDAAYASAKVMIAWDPKMLRGAISLQNMPPPPPGCDYQLWVLDPNQPAPLNAGLLKMTPGSQTFAVKAMNTAGPGFAISLEPQGGRPEPTGEILFAVAPGS